MCELGKGMNVSGIQERSRFGIHQKIAYHTRQSGDEMTQEEKEASCAWNLETTGTGGSKGEK